MEARTSLELDELLSFADEIEKTERTQATEPLKDETEAEPPIEDTEEAASASGFDVEELRLLTQIGQALSDAMGAELSEMALTEELSDEECQQIMFVIFDKVLKAVKKKGKQELDEEDLAYVKAHVEKEAIKRGLQPARIIKRRFATSDRVVCRVGGDRGWAAGTVQALEHEDDEVDPYKTFPYVVQVDPPTSCSFPVPEDTNEWVRAEVAFGRRADAHSWTLLSLPRAKVRGTRFSRRFRVGERVACAVEAPNDGYTVWAAGTVIAVDYPVAGIGGMAEGVVPYQVAIDDGSTVLVHRCEHWLVRDLALQSVGPRTAADGTRTMSRMAKRKVPEGWQMVDHVTRNVRKLEPECEECE